MEPLTVDFADSHMPATLACPPDTRNGFNIPNIPFSLDWKVPP